MFAELYVDESLEKVVEDWDFLSEKVVSHFSTFKPVGQNIYGIRRRVIAPEEVMDPRKGVINRVLELTPRGREEWQFAPLEVHITPGGVPHHVEHNFGYWHINDMDELYLPVPGPTPESMGFFLVIMGSPTGKECDRLAWYCQQCMTLMHETVYETGEFGFNGFWRWEREGVTEYNADVKHRTCPECGHVNPLGYCWNPSKNRPEEELARPQW